MAKFAVVCFDLGSTLLYFDGVMAELVPEANYGLCNALLNLGYRIDPERFMTAFQANLQAYFRQRDIDLIESAVEGVLCRTLANLGQMPPPVYHQRAALHEMYKVTQAHWKLEEDTHPVLGELKQRGYRLGLISNACNSDDVHTQLEQYDLDRYFDQVLISAEVGYRKPHPRIFQRALEFFGVPPHQAVMVGDLPSADICGAHRVGMAGIWITRRAAERSFDPCSQPDAVITALRELPAVLGEQD